MAEVSFESLPESLSHYRVGGETLPPEVSGGFRTVRFRGKAGLVATSIRSRLGLHRHTVNAPRGAATVWVCPLEDLSTAAGVPHTREFEPRYETIGLLSDAPDLKHWEAARFGLFWQSHWYPQLFAKWYVGNIYDDAYYPVPRAFAGAGHLTLRRGRWYMLTVTWEKPGKEYRIYANGVLIATSNRFAESLEAQPCGPCVYAGSPMLALGGVEFDDAVPEAREVRRRYEAGRVEEDFDLDEELRHTFAGAGGKRFEVDETGFEERWALPLTRAGDLSRFRVQGNTAAPSITSQGLLIDNPPRTEPRDGEIKQVYLWTDEAFEGDLRVSYEFMPLRPNGLSLLLLHASGMQREDFMADYAPRTTGSMRMIFGENVRSYHWEYYREMDDTRHDVASSALIKQPWGRALGYRCLNRTLAQERWHRLDFAQSGPRLVGALDGEVVFDVTDDPFAHSNGFLSFGRVAIRCMFRTKLLVRNLRIATRAERVGR